MSLIKELEKELARNCRLNNWDLGFKAAIDIVKQHKCTWDDCSDASYVPCCDIVFCYNPEETQPDFVFCPYCGGKL